MRTFNGGDTWTGTIIPGIDTLESIQFPTPLVGYVSGPGGIFRSNDGGASWRSIKPDSARELWGCYFINADTGVVVGGGCVGSQYFFRTTDGGASWNYTTYNVRSSGLTDVVLLSGILSTGRGYAVSSGYLWITDNGGKTWDTLSSTGQKYWQEELCLSRNSFLLPVAGTTCGGVGTGGGMRFSRDAGRSWSEFQTGQFMFGAFLQNDSSGWACGMRRNIWYTSNYGATWELRDCGIGTVDFDDMWIINETTGWAVGSSIYRLAPPYRSITRTSLDYGETCYPGSRYDTVYIKATSFSRTNGTVAITGDNPADFEIVEPASLNFTILPCDSVRVVVKFTPSSTADLTANLVVTAVNPFTEFNVPLAGKGKRAATQPSETLLDMGNRPCGRFSYDSILFVNPSTDPEAITWIDYVNAFNEIRPTTNVPLTVPASGDVPVVFRTYFADTGTVVNTYRFWIGACPRLLQVRAVGYSPIITAPFSRVVGLVCQTERNDTMLISNTGNAPLVFSDIYATGQDTDDFTIVGWADGAPLLRTIPPKQSAGIIVRFVPRSSGQKQMQLVLKNNDSTTVRGDKTVLIIRYTGGLAGGAIKLATPDSISGGVLCPSGQSTQRIVLRNIGGAAANLTQISSLKQGIRISVTAGQLPRTIQNDDSLAITVFFAPQNPGIILDTLVLRFEPCGEIVRIILHCEGITSQLTASPDTIRGVIQTGSPVRRTITVRSTGTDAAIISAITLTPVRNDWRLINVPDLPLPLQPGKDATVTLEFNAIGDTTFTGKVCFTAEELCDAAVCVPIDIRSIDTKLELSTSDVHFPDNLCSNPVRTQQVIVKNTGSVPDTLVEAAISVGGTDFAVISPTKFPLVLPAGSSAVVVVECRQQNEGTANGELTIRSAKMQPTYFSVPLTARYLRTSLSVDKIAIFFREVEQCDTIRSERLRISNAGMLKEVLSIARNDASPIFGLNTPNGIEVPPGGYIDIDILCKPNVASQTGLYSESIIIKGTVCNEPFNLSVAATIVRRLVTVEPDSLSFGTLIVGDDSVQQVYLLNKGEHDVTVRNVTLASGGTEGFSIIALPTLSRTLQPGEIDSVTVSFHAKQSGISADRLIVVGGAICPGITEIPLTAEVDNRIYPARVSIKDYIVSPADSIGIELRLEGDISDAVIRSIAVRLSFDHRLFYLQDVTADSAGRQISVPYSLNGDALTFILNEAPGAPLGRQGVVATLRGLSLFSIPDTCSINIDIFTPKSRRRTNISTDNGSLTVRSACGPLAGFVPRPVVAAVVVNSGSGNGSEISLRLQANVPAIAGIVLKNLFGNTVFSTSEVPVSETPDEFSIRSDALPSGVYFLEVSASGITERQKIVIFR